MCHAVSRSWLISFILVLSFIDIKPVEARKARVPSLVDWVYTYPERNSLSIGHFDSNIYTRFRMKNDRHNIAMRVVPFVGRMERGKKDYIGESSFLLSYTAPGIIDQKEVAFYSTMPYMRNLRDYILSSMSPSIYEPTLFRDRILSPLNKQNRRYYRYSFDNQDIILENRHLIRIK